MTRILFITASPPLPPTAGGRQRTNLLYRALSSTGQVDTLLLTDPRKIDNSLRQQLEQDFSLAACIPLSKRGQHGPWRFLQPFHPRCVDRLAHNFGCRQVDYRTDRRVGYWVKQRLAETSYDLIIGRYLQPTAQCGVLQSSVPVILDVDDLDTQVYRTRLQVEQLHFWQRIVIQHHLSQLEHIVPRELAKTTHLWLVSESDRKLVDHGHVSVLPNIPFVKQGQYDATPSVEPPVNDCRVVLAVGSLSHRVNVDALDNFTEQAWPAIKSKCPTAVLRIVGSAMSESMRRRWGAVPGVEPVGFVDDLIQAYRQCAFTVAPLFEGGGSKIKVLESLRFNRAVVATVHAQRGYEQLLKHEKALWVANDQQQLVEGCIRLLNAPSLRQTLAERGAQLVNEHFSFDRFQQIVRQTIDSVIASR